MFFILSLVSELQNVNLQIALNELLIRNQWNANNLLWHMKS